MWRLDGEDTGLVVDLLGHVLPDALELAAAGTAGVLRLVVDLAARQVGRQRLALGLLLVALGGWRGHELLELAGQGLEVGVQGLFEQARLLGVEGFALGRELQPLEHGHLVRELVDGGLLERDLALAAGDVAIAARNLRVAAADLGLLGRQLAHQGANHFAQLLRVELFELRRVDHGT